MALPITENPREGWTCQNNWKTRGLAPGPPPPGVCPTCVGPNTLFTSHSGCIAKNSDGKLYVQKQGCGWNGNSVDPPNPPCSRHNHQQTCNSDSYCEWGCPDTSFRLPAGENEYCVREPAQGGIFECLPDSLYYDNGKAYCAWQQPFPPCSLQPEGCYQIQADGALVPARTDTEPNGGWTQYNCSDTRALEKGTWCPLNPCIKFKNAKECIEDTPLCRDGEQGCWCCAMHPNNWKQ